jgi:GNAT superfamily N-acetyltransferase
MTRHETFDDFQVIDDLARREDELVDLFAGEWWTAKRSRGAVDRMLEHTDVVVGLVDRAPNRLIGFARAVTDRTFLALVLDVIVERSYRGRGLGARLVDELLSRPELAEVESVELVCQPELVDFYRRWGFSEKVGRSMLMRRTDNPRLVGAGS